MSVSSGITHPSDQARAKQLFKALYLCGEPIDKGEIRAWAVIHGWEPRHAEALGDLAGKIAAGRSLKGTAMNRRDAEQIVSRLRESMRDS
jgi:hypothetical protein